MGLKNIFNGSLVDVNLVRKLETVSVAKLSCILNLFALDSVQKPWNYHLDFITYLTRIQRQAHLFHLKESRFRSPSKCCLLPLGTF